MHRYLAPASPVFSLWPLAANVADYSNVYTPFNLSVTSAQYAGFAAVLRVASVEISQGISNVAKRLPKGAHFTLGQSLNVTTAVGSFFEAVWSGTRIIKLVAAESGKITAVILFNCLAVIPPTAASRGPRRNPATARLLMQTAAKCTARHSMGRSVDVPNEHGLNAAFFKQLQPKRARCSIVQLYPTQDKDESWKSAMDTPAAKQVAVVPPRTQGAAAAAAARAASGLDADVDSRIGELK
ncbi:hypothetical protein H9P43_007419 [Blastocladiella emersonii ATCC 22665]|nr:hypothetical protein H9P43_007419 [Blastocladiella emersonii ATCC 22665]